MDCSMGGFIGDLAYKNYGVSSCDLTWSPVLRVTCPMPETALALPTEPEYKLYPDESALTFLCAMHFILSDCSHWVVDSWVLFA
jgi:hypothetical protein